MRSLYPGRLRLPVNRGVGTRRSPTAAHHGDDRAVPSTPAEVIPAGTFAGNSHPFPVEWSACLGDGRLSCHVVHADEYAALHPGGAIRTRRLHPAGLDRHRITPENNRVNFGTFNGLRASVGTGWSRMGVEVGGFVLERMTETGVLFTNGTPVAVAQGYIAAGSGIPTSLFASLAGQYSGGVAAVAESRLWARKVTCAGRGSRSSRIRTTSSSASAISISRRASESTRRPRSRMAT